jgi:hypothetical protein
MTSVVITSASVSTEGLPGTELFDWARTSPGVGARQALLVHRSLRLPVEQRLAVGRAVITTPLCILF